METREKRIVVVDDEAEVLKVLGRALSKKGYEVTAFQSPFQALDHLKAQSADLLITDLKMPEMDGIQLMDRLRETLPNLPVIIMTGYATISTAVSAIQLGAFDYIRKPFEMRKIQEVAERALAAHRR